MEYRIGQGIRVLLCIIRHNLLMTQRIELLVAELALVFLTTMRDRARRDVGRIRNQVRSDYEKFVSPIFPSSVFSLERHPYPKAASIAAPWAQSTLPEPSRTVEGSPVIPVQALGCWCGNNSVQASVLASSVSFPLCFLDDTRWADGQKSGPILQCAVWHATRNCCIWGCSRPTAGSERHPHWGQVAMRERTFHGRVCWGKHT